MWPNPHGNGQHRNSCRYVIIECPRKDHLITGKLCPRVGGLENVVVVEYLAISLFADGLKEA